QKIKPNPELPFMSFFRSALAATALLACSFGSVHFASANDAENTVILTLKDGDVTVELRPDLAPKHTDQIDKLVCDVAYDGVAIHEVIYEFILQMGDVQF